MRAGLAISAGTGPAAHGRSPDDRIRRQQLDPPSKFLNWAGRDDTNQPPKEWRPAGAAHAGDRNRSERTMRLTDAEVERTLSQFEAQAIPDDHPVVPPVNRLFGDHQLLLDVNGLNSVGPTPPT